MNESLSLPAPRPQEGDGGRNPTRLTLMTTAITVTHRVPTKCQTLKWMFHFFLIFTAPLGGTFYYFMVQSIEEEAAAQHPQK